MVEEYGAFDGIRIGRGNRITHCYSDYHISTTKSTWKSSAVPAFVGETVDIYMADYSRRVNTEYIAYYCIFNAVSNSDYAARVVG
jgi:hypothetical protein